MIAAAISAFLVLGIAGCGYTTRSMIAGKYRTIYVTPFINKIDITSDVYTSNRYKIYRPLIESDVTRAVVNKYLFDGNLKPTDKDWADVVLKGELISFNPDPVRYTDNDNVAEYRINIVVNISLWDNRNNKLIWQENGFTGDSTYFTSGQFAQSEDSAVTNAINDLARRIVERTVEQW
ncbi:MAG: LptE family protein [Candidatus Omnitrophica bacterium]|nr:LptE family protein [Candidatus Omnitrophota bacterium]